ncbi:MAG: YibE/F family protein [Oscillospiraceae bacterium]|nr:YibE/F family protein [Oscillospiraceae bacterium]
MKQKRIDKKELLTRLLVGVIGFALLLGLRLYAVQGRSVYEITPTSGVEYEKARVLEVLEDSTQVNPDVENTLVGTQKLELEIVSGRYTGDQVAVNHYLSPYFSIHAEEGMTLSVRIITTGDNRYDVSVYNYERTPWLLLFIGVFLLALILIGGRQGISAVFGLLFTMGGVIFVLLPLLVQRGWQPVPTTLLIVALTMFVSFVFIGGLHTKSMVAALGSFGGVLLAGLFAFLAGRIVRISGLNMDEAESLLLTAADGGLKVKGLLICGILIAAEGAIMDISMSVASAVDELHAVNPALSAKELFRSGMNIGRDAMGTMANTLVLAFAGTGLNTMLLIYAYDASFEQLMNAEFLSMELIRAIAGSLGMILAVPLVAFLSAHILKKKQTA